MVVVKEENTEEEEEKKKEEVEEKEEEKEEAEYSHACRVDGVDGVWKEKTDRRKIGGGYRECETRV